MSPEVLNESGHDTGVDWWALGILLFELASGKPPFVNSSIDKIADDIKFEELPMKSYFSKELVSLLTGLTNKNPAKRLGCPQRGGVPSIKNHKFFIGVNWDKILALEV
jgi:serine/threonine protein kinase